MVVLVAGLAIVAVTRSEVPGLVPARISADERLVLDRSDGYVADRVVTPWDHEPAVDRLDRELREALQQAARAAESDGIEVRLNSGWRSRAYQRVLLDEAIARYGSRREARRWVDTPDHSAHVTGDAVDVGPHAAAAWLAQHGAAYGLCQTHANEVWHYEVAPGGCPAPR